MSQRSSPGTRPGPERSVPGSRARRAGRRGGPGGLGACPARLPAREVQTRALPPSPGPGRGGIALPQPRGLPPSLPPSRMSSLQQIRGFREASVGFSLFSNPASWQSLTFFFSGAQVQSSMSGKRAARKSPLPEDGSPEKKRVKGRSAEFSPPLQASDPLCGLSLGGGRLRRCLQSPGAIVPRAPVSAP